MVAAGVGAGFVNAVVGSGSLITFPTLLAVGYPSVLANVSNNIGLVPGAVSGSWGYRRELEGQWPRVRKLAVGSATGALVGAILLLRLPDTVFDAVIPVLILLACALMAFQPRLVRWVTSRRADDAPDVGTLPVVITFLAGIYGGYFGAAQGIILLAMLSVLVPDELNRTNAVKNVLSGVVNATAAIVFLITAQVAWEAVGLIAVGSIVGGQLGAKVGRKVPPLVLRVVVVVVGVGVALRLLLT